MVNISAQKTIQLRWGQAAFKTVCILLMPLAGSPGSTFAYLMLAAWSLGGPRRCLEALTLTWLLGFLNPGIFSASQHAGILRWIVIGTSFICVVVASFRVRIHPPKTIYWLLGFFFLATGLSLFVSYAADVSLFKLLTFFVGASTILIAFEHTKKDAQYWQIWFLTVAVTICLMSFPLIVSPLGYVRNGHGFQGVLSHPQTYAIFIAPVVAWLALLVFENKQWKSRYRFFVPVLIISVVSMVATQSRTSLLAAVGAISIVLVMRSTEQRSLSVWIRLALSIILLGPIFIALMWFNMESATESFSGFLFKGSDADNLGEAFYQSRGAGLQSMFENFLRQPWTGIGFGVPGDSSRLFVSRDPFLGLPVSAPVEKGFAIIAALEELGIFGSILVVGLIGSLLAPIFRFQEPYAASALGTAAFLTNFGEAIFFSFGGSGLLIWLLIGAGRILKSVPPE